MLTVVWLQDKVMRIRCALALYERTEQAIGEDVNVALDVVFQQASTATQLTCREAEISVQSVRWPVRRFAEPLQEEYTMADTCAGRGTCTVVDAAVWVQPRCSSSSAVAQQAICREGNNQASCFPYCMAARRSGSGADGLVLYSASEWRNKVHLYDRDCAYGYLDDPVSSVVSGAAKYVSGEADEVSGGRLGATVKTLNDVLSGVVRIGEWDPVSGGCRESRQAVSLVGVDALTGYRGGRFPSLPLPGQPFSFAGDTTLTTVRKPGGEYVVKVDRLYGDMANEFTLVNVLKVRARVLWVGVFGAGSVTRLFLLSRSFPRSRRRRLSCSGRRIRRRRIRWGLAKFHHFPDPFSFFFIYCLAARAGQGAIRLQ